VLGIEIVPYDPAWPAMFEAEAARLRGALGSIALRIRPLSSNESLPRRLPVATGKRIVAQRR